VVKYFSVWFSVSFCDRRLLLWRKILRSAKGGIGESKNSLKREWQEGEWRKSKTNSQDKEERLRVRVR